MSPFHSFFVALLRHFTEENTASSSRQKKGMSLSGDHELGDLARALWEYDFGTSNASKVIYETMTEADWQRERYEAFLISEYFIKRSQAA